MTIQIGKYKITPTVNWCGQLAYWVKAENGEGFMVSEEKLEEYFDKLFKEWM